MKVLASPKLTVAFFLLAAVGALVAKEGWLTPTVAMLPPFALLLINLLAAILCHPRFRADLPLLVFHLALLALIALFALGRLTYLYGSVSITRDTSFSGVIYLLETGPLHPTDYRKLTFQHAGMVERYNDDVGHRIDISSRLRWPDDRRGWQEAELGFGYPVVLNGYRIYPSGRRGYAPIFLWQPDQGSEELGAVQLFGQFSKVTENTTDWTMPNGQAAWLQLLNLSPSHPPLGAVRHDLDAERLPHKLILRIGEARHELSLGDSVAVNGGRLRYVKLESWGGYSLIYDPTESWLIATIIVAIGSLAWFYRRRFAKSIPLADVQ